MAIFHCYVSSPEGKFQDKLMSLLRVTCCDADLPARFGMGEDRDEQPGWIAELLLDGKALALERAENNRFRTRKMILSQLDDIHQLHQHHTPLPP